MPLILPVVAWGTASDISAAPWTSSGTGSATAGQADPFGGTGAVLLNDTDGAVQFARLYSGVVLTSPTVNLCVCWKADTSTGYTVILRDTTASAIRIQDNGTQSGGVPTQSMVTGTGATIVALGGGWYALRYTATNIVAGNTHRLELYPCANSAAATGTSVFYVRSMVLMDYLDGSVSWSEPREGSAQAQSAGGTEDAWTIGTDEHLRATVRWIPDYQQDTPVAVSGWYGTNEGPGLNMGLKEMLEQGRDKAVLTFVPDRSACSANNVSAYLVEPMRGAPELEANWTRKFTMELRASTVFVGY